MDVIKKPKKSLNERLGNLENNTLLKWFGAVLLIIIGALITYYFERDKPSPRFELKTSMIHPQKPIIIEAVNDAAKKKKPLSIRWDGFKLEDQIPPSDIDGRFEWSFTLSDLKEQGFRFEYLADGKHSIEVGFNGDYQKISDVSIRSKPPLPELLTSYKGKTTLSLNVNPQENDSARLEWDDLPEEIRANPTITEVHRSDGNVDTVIGTNVFIDQSIPQKRKVVYQIAQSDKTGKIYKSSIKILPNKNAVQRQ